MNTMEISRLTLNNHYILIIISSLNKWASEREWTNDEFHLFNGGR